jgi:hypothetical protein
MSPRHKQKYNELLGIKKPRNIYHKRNIYHIKSNNTQIVNDSSKRRINYKTTRWVSLSKMYCIS